MLYYIVFLNFVYKVKFYSCSIILNVYDVMLCESEGYFWLDNWKILFSCYEDLFEII